ncbi:MAG: hypothetical protein K8I27_16655 [Planctomycetes bacterium]|nr:hypothetical protein [Planctomycetota bacterium]
MPIRYMAAFILMVSAGALLAQGYSGFPETRMREGRPDNENVFVPDEMYTQNRVVLRTTEIMTSGRGMQISGTILTDFDADTVPGGDTKTPRGQLSDINVTIELFYYDLVMQRDLTTNRAKTPKIDPKDEGRPVAGQTVTVKPKQSLAGFGMANFQLPVMNKPLAPGLYRLIARVRFKSQSNDLQQAFKYMSDWYGARADVDPETLLPIFEPVTGNSKLHDEVYRTLMDTVGQVKGESLIWIGEIWKNGVLELVPPESGTDRKPANYAIWSHHAVIAEQVAAYEVQLDTVDETVDAALAQKMKVDGATPELIERWKREAEQEKARIRRDYPALIEKSGGRLIKEEMTLLSTSKTSIMTVMDQVLNFHEYLIYRYWVLTDGLLHYKYHSVNVPGYNAWEAVTKQDERLSTTLRLAALEKQKEAPGGLKARWDERTERFKFNPPEVTQAAFEFLKTREETAEWDADKFVEKKNGKVALKLDAAKKPNWIAYREDFIVDFHKESEKLLETVTTTGVYSTQVWPAVLSAARDARDDTIRLTFAWEHLIRTDEQLMAHTSEEVMEEWKRTPTLEGIDLAPYYTKGTAQPGTVKIRFDANCDTVRRTIGLVDFSVAYRRAIEAETDKKNLPGKRPPSAPTSE